MVSTVDVPLNFICLFLLMGIKTVVWGEPKTRSGGMAVAPIKSYKEEWRKIASNPKRRNGRKLPQFPKSEMAMIESHISKTCRIRINDNTERQQQSLISSTYYNAAHHECCCPSNREFFHI